MCLNRAKPKVLLLGDKSDQLLQIVRKFTDNFNEDKQSQR